MATSNSHDTQDEERERLFDLPASQIPFPNSQYMTSSSPAPEPPSDSDIRILDWQENSQIHNCKTLRLLRIHDILLGGTC